MAVPETIRKVPRPVNTIVEDSGSKGNYRYAVRARAGARYNGGNPMPKGNRAHHRWPVRPRQETDGRRRAGHALLWGGCPVSRFFR